MRTFFSYIDYRYILLVLAVVAVLILDAYKAGEPARIRGQVESSRNPEFVVSRIADPDPDIASAAYENIESNPEHFAPALIGTLSSGDSNQVAESLKVITDLNIDIDPGIVQPMLDDNSPAVQVQALRFLSARDVDIDPGIINRIYINAGEVFEKADVIKAGMKYFEPEQESTFLINALLDYGKEVKLAALDAAIALKGDPGTRVLIDALQYVDLLAPIARIELIRRGDTAFDLIIETLSDRRAEVRAASADILGQIGDILALDHLEKMFVDTSYEVGVAVGDAAGRLADESRLQAYLSIIDAAYPDSITSIPATYALGSAEYQPAGQRLMQIASDPGFDSNLRYAAFHALAEMHYSGAEQFLLGIARNDDDDEHTRREAIESLGYFTSDETYALLVETLKGESEINYMLRSSAATALGRMKDRPEALEQLMLRVDKENTTQVLTSIVRALGEFGDVEALPAIEAARAKGVRDTVCDTAVALIEYLDTDDKG